MTNYHFTGIKGSGMSALAQILHDLNENVQGSDIEETIFTQKPLEQKGITLLPFSRDNIKNGQHVIVSAAYGETHEEIKRARELGLQGWVRNRRDGAVEAVFAGPGEAVAKMIEACRQGPYGAHVTGIDQRPGTSEDMAMRPVGAEFAVLPTA